MKVCARGRVAQAEADVVRREFDRAVGEWEAKAREIEKEYRSLNPKPLGGGDGGGAVGVTWGSGGRRWGVGRGHSGSFGAVLGRFVHVAPLVF